MKKVFVLRGFHVDKSAADDDYLPTLEALADQDQEVIPVDIAWASHTHTTFVQEFLARYGEQIDSDTFIVGSSFGAVATLLAVAHVTPARAILCSLSPYFKETLDGPAFLQCDEAKFGKDRLDDLAETSILELAKRVNKTGVKLTFLYGEKEKFEFPWFVDFLRKYYLYFDNATLAQVRGAEHSLRDPNYHTFVAELL